MALWGTVRLRVDFGPGALPSVARTVTVPGGLAPTGDDLGLIDGATGQTVFDPAGFLAAACRLTGRS